MSEGEGVSTPQDHESSQPDPDTIAHLFHVVVNHEQQYSIWDTRRDLPKGWRDEGFVGPEAACLAYIEEVWTDLRPLSLRGESEP